MYSPVFALVLLSCWAAAEEVWPDSTAWIPNTKYTYKLNGRAVTGLHQVSNQYSGMVIRGKVVTQLISDTTLSVKVNNAEFANVHNNLTGGWDSTIPEDKLNWRLMPLSGQPFELKLKRGTISSMSLDKIVPTWEENWYKSIASLFQVDTGAMNLKRSRMNQKPTVESPIGVYKTMEDGVTGKCETLYDVSPWPKYLLQWRPFLAPLPRLKGHGGHFIEVVKSKNYSQCDQTPVFHFGFGGDFKPAGNQMGTFLDRSSISHIMISGKINKYTIQSSVTTNKVILSPHLCNKQKGMMVSMVNLTIESIAPASGPAQRIRSPRKIGNLVYEFNAASNDPQLQGHQVNGSPDVRPSSSGELGISSRGGRQVEVFSPYSGYSASSVVLQPTPQLPSAPNSPLLPLFVGFEGNSIQASPKMDAVRRVKNLAVEIGDEVWSPNSITNRGTVQKFGILVKALSTMNVDQLIQVSDSLYYPLEKTSSESSADAKRHSAWLALRDGIAHSGTGPALLMTITWIKKGIITGDGAVQVIQALENARYPTAEYIDLSFELIKCNEVITHAHLNTTALMSFTNLIRKAIVNKKEARNRYPVLAFERLLPKDDKDVQDKYIPYLVQKLRQAVDEGDSRRIQTYSIVLGNIGHHNVLRVFEDYLEGKMPITQFQRMVMVASLQRVAMIYPEKALPVLRRMFANSRETPEIRIASLMLIMRCNPSAQLLQTMAESTTSEPSNQVRSAVKSAILSAAKLSSPRYYQLSENAKAAMHFMDPKDYGIQYSKHHMSSYKVLQQNMAYKHALTYIQSSDSLIPSSFFYNLRTSLGGFKRKLNHASFMTSSSDDLVNTLFDVFQGGNPQRNREAKNVTEEWTLDKIEKFLNFQTNQQDLVEGNARIEFFGSERLFVWDNSTIESLPEAIEHAALSLSKGQSFNTTKWFNRYPVEIAFPSAIGFPFVYSLETQTYTYAGEQIRAQAGLQSATSGGLSIPKIINATTEIHLVFSAGIHAKFGFISPFNHLHYLVGLETSSFLNVPISAELDVDTEYVKMSTNIKLLRPGNQQKLFEYVTVAYSTVHNIFDLSPHLKDDDARLIHVRPPQKYHTSIGSQSTGFAFDVSAVTEQSSLDLASVIEYFRRHDPVSGLLYAGHEMSIHNKNITVTYNPLKTTSRAVSITLAYVAENSKRHQNANGSQPLPNRLERNTEYLKKVAEGINDYGAQLVDISLKFEGEKTTMYEAIAAYAKSEDSHRSRLMLFTSKGTNQTSGNNKHFQMSLNITAQYPNVPILSYKKALEADAASSVYAQLSFQESAQPDVLIHLLGLFNKTKPRIEYMKQCPLAKLCENQMEEGNYVLPACRASTVKANYLDEYNFNIEYTKIPDHAKNMTYHAYAFARQMAYPYITEDIFELQNEKAKCSLSVAFAPSLKLVNVTLESPLMKSQLNNIGIRQWMMPSLVSHPEYSLLGRIFYKTLMSHSTPVCAVDKSFATTFDNVTYSIRLGECWHVMLHHTPDERADSHPSSEYDNDQGISVLVRDIQSSQKEVKTVFEGYEVNMQPGVDKPVVIVNGVKVNYSENSLAEFDDEDGKTVLQVHPLSEGGVRLNVPQQGIEILFDGQHIKLLASNRYRNEVRGLCGTFDGEHHTDFTAPGNCILTNPYEFAASYALPDASCKGPAQDLQPKSQNAACLQHEIIPAEVMDIPAQPERNMPLTRHPNEREVPSGRTGCTKYQAYVLKQAGKVCFSLRPQIACSLNCRPNRTVEKILDFHCIADLEEAHRLLDIIANGDATSLTKKGANHKARVTVPEQCITK